MCIGSIPQQLSYGGKGFDYIHILQPLSASIAASSCSSFLCSWYFKQKPNETLACEKLQHSYFLLTFLEGLVKELGGFPRVKAKKETEEFCTYFDSDEVPVLLLFYSFMVQRPTQLVSL